MFVDESSDYSEYSDGSLSDDDETNEGVTVEDTVELDKDTTNRLEELDDDNLIAEIPSDEPPRERPVAYCEMAALLHFGDYPSVVKVTKLLPDNMCRVEIRESLSSAIVVRDVVCVCVYVCACFVCTGVCQTPCSCCEHS